MTITITANSYRELMELARGLLAGAPSSEAEANQVARPVPTTAEPAMESTSEPEPVAEHTPGPKEPAVTEDYRVEVRKVLAKLNKKTGTNTASELIKSFGAERLTDVALQDLPALMARAEEAFNAN